MCVVEPNPCGLVSAKGCCEAQLDVLRSCNTAFRKVDFLYDFMLEQSAQLIWSGLGAHLCNTNVTGWVGHNSGRRRLCNYWFRLAAWELLSPSFKLTELLCIQLYGTMTSDLVACRDNLEPFAV